MSSLTAPISLKLRSNHAISSGNSTTSNAIWYNPVVSTRLLFANRITLELYLFNKKSYENFIMITFILWSIYKFINILYHLVLPSRWGSSLLSKTLSRCPVSSKASFEGRYISEGIVQWWSIVEIRLC